MLLAFIKQSKYAVFPLDQNIHRPQENNTLTTRLYPTEEEAAESSSCQVELVFFLMLLLL